MFSVQCQSRTYPCYRHFARQFAHLKHSLVIYVNLHIKVHEWNHRPKCKILIIYRSMSMCYAVNCIIVSYLIISTAFSRGLSVTRCHYFTRETVTDSIDYRLLLLFTALFLSLHIYKQIGTQGSGEKESERSSSAPAYPTRYTNWLPPHGTRGRWRPLYSEQHVWKLKLIPIYWYLIFLL